MGYYSFFYNFIIFYQLSRGNKEGGSVSSDEHVTDASSLMATSVAWQQKRLEEMGCYTFLSFLIINSICPRAGLVATTDPGVAGAVMAMAEPGVAGAMVATAEPGVAAVVVATAAFLF